MRAANGHRRSAGRTARLLSAAMALAAVAAASVGVSAVRASADAPVGWTLTDLGANGFGIRPWASINDAGQVAFTRWHPEDGTRRATVWSPTAVVDLPGFPVHSIAVKISESGAVIGQGNDSRYLYGVSAAYRWTPQAGMVDLGSLGNTGSTFAVDVNASGQVIGRSADDNWMNLPFRTNGGAMEQLASTPGASGAAVEAINDAGQAVGLTVEDNGSRAVLWPANSNVPLDLGSLGGAVSSATDINQAGTVVGVSENGAGEPRAFLWTAAAGMIDLGPSVPRAINNSGQVLLAGTGPTGLRTYLYDPADGIIDLGTTGNADTSVDGVDLNDAGQVVGNISTADGSTRAFVWSRSVGIVDLGTLPGGSASYAADINNDGQIAGFASDGAGENRVVLWDPPLGGLTPPTPSGLTATTTGTDVSLAWQDNASNETGFEVLRARWSINSSSWTGWHIAPLAANTTAYTELDVPTGQYAYLVRAVNANGASPWVTAIVWRSPSTSPPATPTGIGARSAGSAVEVTWTDQSADEFGFQLERARWNPGVQLWTEWTDWTLGSDVTHYTDTPSLDGRYAYLVRAYNPNGASTWAITVVSHTDDTTPPPVLTDLQATSGPFATLNWTDNSAHEHGYDIMRAAWDPVAANWTDWTHWGADANATSHVDVAPPGTYAYAVRAYNTIGAADWAVAIATISAP